jgi:hypothetical protein
MATKITRQILEAYLNCKTKAHLKLAGQQGIVSDYEALLVANRQAVRRQAIEKILARNPETEVARDISLTAAALGKGPSFVLNATLEDDLLSIARYSAAISSGLCEITRRDRGGIVGRWTKPAVASPVCDVLSEAISLSRTRLGELYPASRDAASLDSSSREGS